MTVEPPFLAAPITVSIVYHGGVYMEVRNLSAEGSYIQDLGVMDYVQDGVLHVGAVMKCVMVPNVDALPELSAHYTPGAIAFVAGLGTKWQMDAMGEWHEIGADTDVPILPKAVTGAARVGHAVVG